MDISLRCAAFARSEHVDAVGTAGSYDVVVLVELPLPWATEVTDHPLMAAVAEAARQTAGLQRRIRVQALAPDPKFGGNGPEGPGRTAIAYIRPDGPFLTFERSEGKASAEDIPSLVQGLISNPAAHPGPTVASDVLLCTHGARDSCCGSLGTGLWKRARELIDEGHRLWRTSHTGGHRFAPTAMIFPSGQSWGYLDEHLLHGIITRSLSPDRLLTSYRGCVAFGTPTAQAAERSAFTRHGWDWLAARRWAEEIEPGAVRICYEEPDGRSGAYDADVAVVRDLPVPVCGRPLDEATKLEPELRVTRFRAV